MTLPNIYSRRKRQAAKTAADVYQYVDLSPKLRQQMLFAFYQMAELAVRGTGSSVNDVWETVVEILREEQGVEALVTFYCDWPRDEFGAWFKTIRDVDTALDAVEIVTRICAHLAKQGFENTSQSVKDCITKINDRMLEAQFGFQVEDGTIVELSSQFAHAEIVVPALLVLNEDRFATANVEFRKAHEEFRNQSYADCITDCGKALESVFKVIAGERGWPSVSDNSTMAKLIEAAVTNNLFPGYMEEQIKGLRAMLQGAGTVRNKDGAHGKGDAPSLANRDLAAYQLHQTAAALIFLAAR
jgi:AbiJ N-terminal domain 4